MTIRGLIALFFITLAGPLAAQQQGIRGQVFWLYGDNMPDPELRRQPMQGIEREIHVYELTTLADVEEDHGFIKKIYTKYIGSTFSRSDGTFRMKLPPGRYSLFVKEPGGLYANLFDSDNNICPITVKARQYSWMTITIDYEAHFDRRRE